LVKKAIVVNLGCPKNQVDSEVITGFLAEKYDIVQEPEAANIIVVNTCAFIEEAKEEAIEVLLEMIQLKNTGVCEKVVAVGCFAERYGGELMAQMPEIDGVFGDGDPKKIVSGIEKLYMVRLLTWKKEQDYIYDHKTKRERSTPFFTGYIKIAEGCDNHCSYCVIPSIRGHYRSRKIESIMEEAKLMVSEGVKEIILIAQDTTVYGLDVYKELKLPKLLRILSTIEGLKWIRIMYCYPENFTDELIDVMRTEPKICKYVDLPLQHADNGILKEMNRKVTAEEAELLISKIRNAIPSIIVRTTFITGFPGETQKQYQTLINYIKKVKFDRLGVFAYSREENTAAGRREDQIPMEIREKRRDELMEVQNGIAYETQQTKVGKIINIILEEKVSDGLWIGRSEGDAPEVDNQVYVKEKYCEYSQGDMIPVKIIKADTYDLIGEGIK